MLLQQAMAECKNKDLDSSSTTEKDTPERVDSASYFSARIERYYTSKETEVSEDVLAFVKTAFSKQLDKCQETDNILVALSMESGMKEFIKRKFGYHKTKEVCTTDEALAARQAPFIAVARPLAATLDILEDPEDDNEDGADPDVIKALLEDALILLGNANIGLNNWRQNRFSEFLTEARWVKAHSKNFQDIPTDKHLFPDQFHKAMQSEYYH
jgi:hypothetical protein